MMHRNRRPAQRVFDAMARHGRRLRYANGTRNGKPTVLRNIRLSPLIHNGRKARR